MGIGKIKPMPSTRRTLLKAGLAAAVSPYLAPGAGSPVKLITLSPSPTDLEMPVEGFVDEITPTEHFFVRCHTMTPKVDAATWKLEITGLVERPLSLTLPDLKRMPRTELTRSEERRVGKE